MAPNFNKVYSTCASHTAPKHDANFTVGNKFLSWDSVCVFRHAYPASNLVFYKDSENVLVMFSPGSFC